MWIYTLKTNVKLCNKKMKILKTHPLSVWNESFPFVYKETKYSSIIDWYDCYKVKFGCIKFDNVLRTVRVKANEKNQHDVPLYDIIKCRVKQNEVLQRVLKRCLKIRDAHVPENETILNELKKDLGLM